jgi:hypothetical protein
LWQRYAAIAAACFARSVIEYTASDSHRMSQAAPVYAPAIDTKLDSMSAQLSNLTRLIRPQAVGSANATQEFISAQFSTLIDGIANAWQSCETKEALRLAEDLTALISEYEFAIAPDLRASAYTTLINAAVNEARFTPNSNAKPDMSKAKSLVERAKRVR